MIVQVNTEVLLKHRLTPNQFLLMQLVLDEKQQVLSRLLKLFPGMQQDIDTLISIDVLRRIGRANEFGVTDNCKNQLFGKDLFEELLALFPTYTIRPTGTKEFLKTDLRRSKAKYSQITKDQIDSHETILRCLQLEIKTKTATGSMKYFKKIYNWLTSEGWKEFEPLLNTTGNGEVEPNLSNGYGTAVE